MLTQENAEHDTFSLCKRGNCLHPAWGLGGAGRPMKSSGYCLIRTSHWKYCPGHTPPHHVCGVMGTLGKVGWSPDLPYSHRMVLPGCPRAWDHSLLTGLHQLYEIGEENIPVPFAEATDVIRDLEGGGIAGHEVLRPRSVGGLTA